MRFRTFMSVAMATSLAASTAFAGADDLTVFDWSGYEDAGFYGAYKDKHGGKPSYTFFASVDEAFTKLQSGFAADLAHPCSDAVRKWHAAGLLQPLDTSKLKNWDAMLPEIRNVDGVEIDGQIWMMPFEWAA